MKIWLQRYLSSYAATPTYIKKTGFYPLCFCSVLCCSCSLESHFSFDWICMHSLCSRFHFYSEQSPLEFGFKKSFKNKVNEMIKSTFGFVCRCLLSTFLTKCEQKEAKWHWASVKDSAECLAELLHPNKLRVTAMLMVLNQKMHPDPMITSPGCCQECPLTDLVSAGFWGCFCQPQKTGWSVCEQWGNPVEGTSAHFLLMWSGSVSKSTVSELENVFSPTS